MTELEGLWRLAVILAMQTVVMLFGFMGIGYILDKILEKIGDEKP